MSSPTPFFRMTLWACALALVSLSVAACGSKDSGTSPAEASGGAPPASATGSQSPSELAGRGLYCATDETLNGTFANLHVLSLSAGGAYTYTVYLTDAAACTTATTSSGNNYATYSQDGTYAISEVSGAPGTASGIIFTVATSNLIVRAGTFPAGPAPALAAWLNGNCAPAPGFSPAADSSASLLGAVCAGSGGFSPVALPGSRAALKNIAYNTGSALEIGASAGANLWQPGGTSFPASYAGAYQDW